MRSHASLENYLEIDHRDSPGFTEAEARAARFGRTMPVGSHKFQLKTYTCCGCEVQVIVREARTRPRNYCRSCDKYMCDDCALEYKITGLHRPMQAVVEELFNRALAGNSALVLGK